MGLFFRLTNAAIFAGLAAVPGYGSDAPARVEVPVMKTSIYIGSVTLSTSSFERTGETYTADYEARVFPWAFWNEKGTITVEAPEMEMKRLVEGEIIELSGAATNHKGKPRTVSIKATPGDPPGGKIKVRIKADGIELIFNGEYTATASAETTTN